MYHRVETIIYKIIIIDKKYMENKINFINGIIKVLKQFHPSMSFQKTSLNIINDMIVKLGEKIVKTAIHLGDIGKKKTIGHREIKIASILLIPGELSKHALSEGDKSIIKDNWKRIQFKLGKSRKLIEKHILKDKLIGHQGIIYLTAVLEYIAAEIIHLSGNATKDNHFVQIKPRHIMLAIKNDEELNVLFQGYILGSGVFPKINDALYNNYQKGGKTMKKNLQLKNNRYYINDIRDPALKKLLYKAGVKYVSKSVYLESRFILHDMLKEILRKVHHLRTYDDRRTVMYKDGIEALKILNINIFNTRGYPGRLSSCKGSEKIKELPKNKIRRRKPKNNLLRLIRNYQKTRCTLLPHAPIKRLIIQTGNDIDGSTFKYETDFIWLMQAVCEEYLVSLYKSSLLIAIHCERKTLTSKDILLVKKIRNEMIVNNIQ